MNKKVTWQVFPTFTQISWEKKRGSLFVHVSREGYGGDTIWRASILMSGGLPYFEKALFSKEDEVLEYPMSFFFSFGKGRHVGTVREHTVSSELHMLPGHTFLLTKDFKYPCSNVFPRIKTTHQGPLYYFAGPLDSVQAGISEMRDLPTTRIPVMEDPHDF